MANLSSVTDLTRKALEILVIGTIGLILLVILFNVGVSVKNALLPTPAPAPTVTFGKIPVLTFATNTVNPKYTYTINTLSGILPILPDRITVYKLQQPVPNLLELDKANGIVSAAGFLNPPVGLSDTSYKWSKTDPFTESITMNIQSFDFFFTGDYKNNAVVKAATHMPDEGTAQTVAKTFFDTTMPLPASIDPSKTKTTLLAITPTGLQPASSLSNAQIIRIDYFPKAIDTYPTYTANPDESLIYAYVASTDFDYPQMVEAQYYHKDITNEKATYPIKTAQQALDDLKQGKGYIAANPTGNTNVNITDVTLGYYVDSSPQQYLWPIIVIQGDKGFYAYVSAIQDSWVQE